MILKNNMGNGNIITNNGQLIMLNRTFKSSPDYSAPSVFKVGTNTTTPTELDTDLGAAVSIDGGNTKSFVSGYPSIDETARRVTTRCFLNTLEANGNSLTEFGIFNTDGSPLMYSRSVFSAISKSSTVEVSIVQKDKLE